MAKYTVKNMPGWLIALISLAVVVVLAVIGIFIYAESTDQSFIDVFNKDEIVEDSADDTDDETNTDIDINDGDENVETTAVITVFR